MGVSGCTWRTVQCVYCDAPTATERTTRTAHAGKEVDRLRGVVSMLERQIAAMSAEANHLQESLDRARRTTSGQQASTSALSTPQVRLGTTTTNDAQE